jgi:hypothetical protein
MLALISKGEVNDMIRFARDDGSVAQTHFPHKGPIPHDAVHYFVERALAMRRGFWGMVSQGVHPEDLLAIAKAAGHASASRCTVPDEAIIELIQAERIVECFEADFWSDAGTAEDLLALAEVACSASHVSLPPMDADVIAGVRADVMAFSPAWLDLPIGGAIGFDWPPLADRSWSVHDAGLT